jgi:four helix bundle protein
VEAVLNRGPQRPVFRFMKLEIWKDAVEVAGLLFSLADRLEGKRLYRFAEQIRGSALSMSNNIAEGSGSDSNREFARYLDIARKSTFENANAVMVMETLSHIGEEETTVILERLDHLCRKITNFKRTLPE